MGEATGFHTILREIEARCSEALTLKIFKMVLYINRGFPRGSVVSNLPTNAGDSGVAGSIPGLGRSPGEGKGNPLSYSHL